eukprot:6182844-Pleurochrysis_carterae.AAC.2
MSRCVESALCLRRIAARSEVNRLLIPFEVNGVQFIIVNSKTNVRADASLVSVSLEKQMRSRARFCESVLGLAVIVVGKRVKLFGVRRR